MWIATDCGITHIIVVDDPTAQELQYRCYSYFNEDGIGDITFNNYSIYCNRKGEVLMGGTGKYLKIDLIRLCIIPTNIKLFLPDYI